MRTHFRSIYLIVFEVIGLMILAGMWVVNNHHIEQAIEVATTAESGKKYIKWVEFDVTYSALDKAYKYDVQTHGQDVELHWIELLAYLGAKYGGDFSRYKERDMVKLADCLLSKEETMESLTTKMEYYPYYYEAYEAVLGGLVGEYEIEVYKEAISPTITKTPKSTNSVTTTVTPDQTNAITPTVTPNQTDTVTPTVTPSKMNAVTSTVTPNPTPLVTNSVPQPTAEPTLTPAPEKVWVSCYGLKGFSPIARNYYYNDFDDFGVSRSYGYKRQHLGHDMMGSVGTPIIAAESGYVEALGWNQYGGWRIGIRSFDGRRYYYYAHLRKNFPYNKSLEVGSIVTAGDVIGYLGRTGYSAKENTNNISTSHLHFGLQLIFDESQKDGNNEIWVDCYALTKFLYRNRCETVKNLETKEYSRVFLMKDPAVEEYKTRKNMNPPLDKDATDGIIIEYD